MNYEEHAHGVNRLIEQGRREEARELAASCVNQLFAEEASVSCKFNLASPEALCTASRAHLRIRAQPRGFEISGSEQLVEGRFTNWLDAFVTIARLLSQPPASHVRAGSIIFDIEDASNLGQYERIAFNSGLAQAALVTDSYWHRFRGYEQVRQEIRQNWVPWRNRLVKVFWRGSTTGLRRYTPQPGAPVQAWDWLQRLQLCETARASARKEIFDIGITKVVQIPERHLSGAVLDSGFMVQSVPKMKFLQYRYIVDIDGNGCAWDGFFTALVMGACVIKIGSHYGWREWFYDRLVPGEHYLPVKADLSDFDSQVGWALAHEDACEKMGLAAKEVTDQMDYLTEVRGSAEVVAKQFENSYVRGLRHETFASRANSNED